MCDADADAPKQAASALLAAGGSRSMNGNPAEIRGGYPFYARIPRMQLGSASRPESESCACGSRESRRPVRLTVVQSTTTRAVLAVAAAQQRGGAPSRWNPMMRVEAPI